jgi:hypothetical protein
VSRFPNGRAINSLPFHPGRVNPRIGTGRKNAPGGCNSLGAGAKNTAFAGRNHDVSQTAGIAIEHEILDFANILAARVLDLRPEDAATLDIAGRGGLRSGGLGLSDT